MNQTPLISRPVNQRGAFTLVELLAVVLVLSVLVGLLISTVNYINRKVLVSRTKADMAAIENALEMYKGDWGEWRLVNGGLRWFL